MRKLKLSNSKKFALVDDDDYESLVKFKWYYAKSSGIRRARLKSDPLEYPDKIKISRQILNFPNGVVDHKDTDVFNNQKSNLRVCTQSQNSKNQSKPIGVHSSKYKGVSWTKNYKKWESYIKVNYKKINLGYYDVEKEAAIKYNEAAIKYFGEFANLNEFKTKKKSS